MHGLKENEAIHDDGRYFMKACTVAGWGATAATPDLSCEKGRGCPLTGKSGDSMNYPGLPSTGKPLDPWNGPFLRLAVKPVDH